MNEIRALPGRQTRYLELYAVKRLLYSGMKGAGKTTIALIDMMRDIHHADSAQLFIRKTFPSLESAIAESRKIFPNYDGVYNGQRHCWNFPSGARIYMRCLDNQSDLETVTGQQYNGAIVIDEAGFIPLEHIELVWSCARTVNPEINCRLRLLTNPQGISAHELWEEYVYSHAEGEIKFWERQEDDSWKECPSTEGESKTWLFSVRDENTYLVKGYDTTLKNLSYRLRTAYLSGELIIETEPGQLVSYESIDAALAKPPTLEQGFYILSLDAAGAGGDSSVIHFGIMNQIKDIIEITKKTIPQLVDIVAKYFDQYKDQLLCVIDSVGLGVGVSDGLKAKYPQFNSHIIAIGARSAGLDEKIKNTKYSPNLKFKSYRDWLCWNTRIAFEENKINLSQVRLNKHINILKKEVGAIKWSDDSGVIETTNKKVLRKANQLGGSPDFFDSLVLYVVGLTHYGDRMRKPRPVPRDNGYGDIKTPDTGINGSGDLNWV